MTTIAVVLSRFYLCIACWTDVHCLVEVTFIKVCLCLDHARLLEVVDIWYVFWTWVLREMEVTLLDV